MVFGTDAFYRRLKAELYAEDNWEIHALLFHEVEDAAKRVAWRFFPRLADREDAVAEALNKVFTVSIHAFLEDPAMEFMDERGRNNWLYKVIKNAMLDFYRRQHVREGQYTVVDGVRIFQPHLKLNVGEELTLADTLRDPSPDPLTAMTCREDAEEALAALFSMNAVGAEKLVTVGWLMLSIVYGNPYGAKQLNSAVAEELSGRTLRFNFLRLRDLLRKLELPDGLLQPLARRLDQTDADGQTVGDRMMELSTRMVTKSVSDARVRLRQQFPSNSVVERLPTTERMKSHD